MNELIRFQLGASGQSWLAMTSKSDHGVGRCGMGMLEMVTGWCEMRFACRCICEPR